MTTLTSTTTNNRTRSTVSAAFRLTGATALAAFISGAANIALYYAAGAVAPTVTAWPGAGIGQIIGAGFGYLTFGAVALAIVNRLFASAKRAFVIIATLGLIGSFWLPISAGLGMAPGGMPAADVATVVTLALMHVVSYAVSMPLFLRLAKK